MPVDLKRVKEIFLAAVEKTDTAERQAFLRECCGADEELLCQVEALLRQHEQASGFLESPPPGLVQTVDSDQGDSAVTSRRGIPAGESVGTQIGPYKLLKKLGEGGMGAVWVAEQIEPVKRRVALKLIKSGMDSAHVLSRFEAERQALALMDHPNIAKVLDAGTTDAGRPYFVMEQVKGISITKYCDQEHLTPKERLELFIPVCQAVQHAHQKGIIHRDLKPSNVLVGLYDDKPIPKVIDFGIAKATAHNLTEQTMCTEVGQIIGTLEYMSPEQAELTNVDIDTRADIYSLGVILYELLTGSPPFTAKQLRSAAFTEMLRVIREMEPPKPSTKLSGSGELASIAANRHLEPKKLAKLVHGELDWIVMKCLEKDRRRRYETASGLAMEIHRYLADEPVQAGPPTAGYKLRKFSSKHKKFLITAAAFAALLVLGAVVSTWQAIRATLAERQALAAIAAEKSAKDAEAEQRSRAAEAEAAKARVEATKAEEQRVLLESNMKLALKGLGLVYKRHEGSTTALIKQARLEAIENDIALHEEVARNNSALYSAPLQYEMARANMRLGGLYVEMEQWDGAATAYRRATEILEKLADKTPEVLDSRLQLAIAYYWLGRVLNEAKQRLDAKQYLYKSLTAAESLIEETPTEVRCHDTWFATLNLLANLADRPQEAAQLVQRQLNVLKKLIELDPKHAQTHQSRLGDALGQQGDFVGAIVAFKKSIELSPNDVWLWYCLADAHLAAGQRDAHRQVCADLLKRFAKTKEPNVAARALYACLPVSDALADMTQLVPLAKLAATNKAHARVLGATLYRAGKYAEAIEPLKQGQGRAWDHLFLAMAHHHLDHEAQAHDYLKLAIRQIEKAGYPWKERLESEHLRREAEALIKGIRQRPDGGELTLRVFSFFCETNAVPMALQ